MSDSGLGGGGGGKLDRWLSRAKTEHAEKPGSLVSANGATGTSAEKTTLQISTPSSLSGKPPPSPSSRSPAARGTSGGVGACCNLIRLLDPDELARVHEVLVAAMREKNVPLPVPPDCTAGGPHGNSSELLHRDFEKNPMVLTAAAGESFALLMDMLEEVRKLGSEAARRLEKCSSSANSGCPPSTPGPAALLPGLFSPSTDDADADPPPISQKMSKWISKVNKNKKEPVGAPEATTTPAHSSAPAGAGPPASLAAGEDGAAPPPSGKAARWIQRTSKSKDSAATAAGIKGAVCSNGVNTGETPLEFVQRACAAVRASWATGGGSMTLTEEWDKLKLERASIGRMLEMVYAVKQTPEKVDHGAADAYAGGVANCAANSAGGGTNSVHTNGGRSPAAGAQQGGPGAQMQRSVAVTKPDPDKLLAEFLAARREERVKETAQMINDKKNPKKPETGSGWRAGSPMASAATPTVPVRISLTRQPPPPPPPMMLGPPPEGLSELGSAQDVINKEGGGFFFYPPGHPNYVPGGPASANIQLEGQLRSTVHPQERIAPHWSRAKFTAHGMPEVACEARHATFGPLKEVSGRLVRCNPPLANKEITNEHQVRGNIVYIKRGGCSFTKKARVAQKAGAVGMVVANSDRETFGMSYTDDGEPFESICIPCVMISSDICAKLEACKQSPDGRAPWTCTFTPLVERQQNVVYQDSMQGAMAQANAQNSSDPSSPLAAGGADRERDSAQMKDQAGFLQRIKHMLP